MTRSPSPDIPRKRPRIQEEPNSLQDEMSKPVEYAKVYDNELEYRNKLVLAPMVRTGSRELNRLTSLTIVPMVCTDHIKRLTTAPAIALLRRWSSLVTRSRRQGHHWRRARC